MFKLSNGHVINHVTASGAMGPDGNGHIHEQPLKPLGLLDTRLFTHVIKSLVLPPRPGNYRFWKPWDTIKFIWKDGKIVGVRNAYGLTQPGFYWWMKKYGKKIDSKKNKVMGSIFGDPDELAVMANALNDVDFVGLVYNASCPNTKSDTLSNIDKIVRSCEKIKNRTPIRY